MFFQDTDKGPFYFSKEEKQSCCYDQNVGGSKSKQKNVTELRKELKEAGVDIALGTWHAADLHALACQHGLEITTESKRSFLVGKESKRCSPNIMGVQVDC